MICMRRTFPSPFIYIVLTIPIPKLIGGDEPSQRTGQERELAGGLPVPPSRPTVGTAGPLYF